MKISASIQAANQLDLLNHIDSNNTKFDQLHIDITDGHFAENISMSFKVIEMLKNNTDYFLDIHLMINDNLKYSGKGDHIDGLIQWLKRIAEDEKIKTVTPASLSKAKGRGEKLVLKITIKTNEGFKLLARKGKLVQEVFLVTHMDEDEIKELIKETSP